MTRFRYRAVDGTGAMHRGSIEAESLADARVRLRRQGFLAVSLSVAFLGAGFGAAQIFGPMARVTATDIAIFTRQMATLISSGVQVEAALSAVADQSAPRLAALSRAVRTDILNGGSLHAALGQQGGRLDRFYVTSVRAGERAGRLGEVLSHLADHVETAQRHRQTITLALIYPAILIVVSVAVVVALLIFVLPDIVRVFAARGAELPPLTKAMIAVSRVISGYGPVILLLLAVIGAGLAVLWRRPDTRRIWHRAVWRIGLARQIVLVQFTGTMSTLTQSGVPLTEALTAATATVGNLEARACFADVASEVRKGTSLSRAFAAYDAFPPMMITMISSGEASGRLPAMLGRFWADQSQSLQARIKAFVGLVEPLVLLAMGGIVMLLVLAILLPIINLNTLVG
ncbi:MAG: type II secretion system F family protein [Pseudomonadota bacterium]